MSITECIIVGAGLGVLWPLYEPLFEAIAERVYRNKQR